MNRADRDAIDAKLARVNELMDEAHELDKEMCRKLDRADELIAEVKELKEGQSHS